MDTALEIANSAAAQTICSVLKNDDAMQLALHWPTCGAIVEQEINGPVVRELMESRARVLADFVRLYPDAGLEPMYRHAGGQGVHDRPADGFDDIEPAFRIAYAVFRSTLLEADRVFAEEEARAAAKARAEAVQPPVIVPREDTILAQHGSIFDRIGDAPEMVNLGGPVVAASEGEGGDEAGLAGAAAGPGDDGGQAAGNAVSGAADDPGAAADPQGGDVGRGEVPQAPADPAAVNEGEGGDGQVELDQGAQSALGGAAGVSEGSSQPAADPASDQAPSQPQPAADNDAGQGGDGDAGQAGAGGETPPDPVGAAPRVGSRRKS